MQQSSIIKPGTTPVRFADAVYIDRTLHSLTATGQPLEFFIASGTITAAAAATPINVVPDAAVGSGRKVYVLKATFDVGGATAWADASATDVRLQDTNGTPVDFLTVAKAALTGNSLTYDSGASNVTRNAGVRLATKGGTTGKGLQIVGTNSGTAANFTSGSDLTVEVFGYIK